MRRRTLSLLISMSLLFSLAAGTLTPKPVEANTQLLPPAANQLLLASSVGNGTTTAPYRNPHRTWTHTLGWGEAWARANYQTGFISATAFSGAGGASAQAEQWITVNVPNGQVSEVTVIADIIHMGGSEKLGISASAWGGSEIVYYIGNEEHRETLDPVFGLGDVVSAVVDFGLTVAPLAGELAGLKETAKILKVLDVLEVINGVNDLRGKFMTAYNAGDAEYKTIAFSFTASQPTQVGIGVRVDTSGAIAGSCITTVFGLVDKIYVNINPVTASSYLNFDSWSGGSADITDNGGSSNKGIPNGPSSISPGRLGKGIHFDGDHDWVKVDFASNEKTVLTQQGTFELWIKPEQTADSMCVYGGSGSSADGLGGDKEIHFGTTSSGAFNFYMGSYNTNQYHRLVYFGSYTPGNWYHIAVTYVNTPWAKITCYVNGHRTVPLMNYCTNEALSANLSVDDILLGGPNAHTNFFKGSMDDVRIFSRVLNDNEVLTHCWQGIDTTAPSVPVLLQKPAFSPGTENYVICNPASDIESGVWQYYFERSPGGNGGWTTSPNYLFQNLTDGVTYTYRVKARDRMGNESAWSATVGSTQDNTPPAGGGMPTFGIQVVGQVQDDQILFDFPISTSDSGSGLYEIYTDQTVQNDHFFSTPYPATVSSLRLSIPLYAGPQFGTSWQSWISGMIFDAVGNSTYFSWDNVKIDYLPPEGSITIDSGAAYTHDDVVDLNLTWFHPPRDMFEPNGSLYFGVSAVKVSNDNSTWSNWKDLNTLTGGGPTGSGFGGTYTGWQISSGYGYKTVYAQFKDAAGHLSPVYSDTIGYGPVPSGQISINNNALWSTSAIVTLTLNSPNASKMALWNENQNPPASYNWVAYNGTTNWPLSAGSGSKTVYARFKDSVGQETSNYSDTIELDLDSLTGSVSINNGSSHTNSTNVTLNLSLSSTYSGNREMRFSNGESWSGWENFQTTRVWQVPPGESEKSVSAQFRNAAGRSASSSDTIYLDLCPPSGTLVINNRAAFTGTTAVSLKTHVSGEDYSVPEQTSSNQGDRGWYYYKAKDAKEFKPLVWDNIVSPDSQKGPYSWNDQTGPDDIAFLKVTGPDQGGIIQTGNGGDGAFNNVAIVWLVDGKDKIIDIRGGLWAKSTGQKPDSADTKDDGVFFSIYLKGKSADTPQLISKETINIVHDSEMSKGIQEVSALAVKPGDSIIFYIDRGKYCDNDQVYYRFSIIDPLEAAPCSVRFANLLPGNINSSASVPETLWWQALTGVTWGGWQTCNPDFTDNGWAIPAGDGTKTVLAQFKDGAGNISTPLKALITLDQSAPVIQSMVINNGTLETYSPDVKLAISATDSGSGISQMRISENGATGSWQAYSRTPSWKLSQAGERRLAVQLKDAAGNLSTAVEKTISYTPAASDASLSNLTINAGILDPAFSRATLRYTASVGSGVTSVTVTPITNQSQSTVTVNDKSVASGSPSRSITLNTGINAISIVVTAGDKSTRTYTISVIRTESSVLRPALAPASPTNLSIAVISASQTKLTWKDNSSNETVFEIYRQEPTVKDSRSSLVGTVKANTTTFTDSGLNPGSTYNYQVVAMNASGRSDFSAKAEITLPSK
jgi:hypothetical protein